MTTTDVAQPTTPSSEENNETSSGRSISRIAMLVSIGLSSLILIPLIFALAVSLTASETWAPVVQIFRDTFIIVFFIEFILVIGATSILIVQIARFFSMLQSEIKPILDNARETTKTTKATAKFVNQNAVDPLIQIKSFFAGLATFIREILRIRSLIKPTNSSGAEDDTT
jgi:uncharacterized membrane protein (DUF106 family)